VHSLVKAELEGDRLTEEEIIANCIITLVGGLETTTNLIGNGMLTLLCHPDETRRLRSDPALIVSAVEELLRFESPSQHTARLAPADLQLGGKAIRKRQAVIAVMGAGNRDPSVSQIQIASTSRARTIAILRSAGPPISVSARR